MKTINFTLFFTIVFVQLTFSQVQISCGGINSVLGASNTISFLKMNDCSGDLIISIDESLLSNNETINLEGEMIKNRESIRIVGNQNHSISLVPFDMDNKINKKVIALHRKLPEEMKTRIRSSKEDPKRSAKLEGEIKIYPNPIDSNDDEITISSPKTQPTILSYTLRNSYGAIILQEYFPDSDTIDVSNLNTGMYYIKIQTIQQVITKQIIKN